MSSVSGEIDPVVRRVSATDVVEALGRGLRDFQAAPIYGLLFGALFQGGAEVSFDVPGFTRDMVVMMQGLIVLVSGAMAHVVSQPVARLIHLLTARAPSSVKEVQHG